MDHFWLFYEPMVLILTVIGILEDFGSLLPARPVAVKEKMAFLKNFVGGFKILRIRSESSQSTNTATNTRV